jgi:putative ATP-binding cassette transporter
LSLFGRANVALEKVEQLGLSLAHNLTEACSTDRPEPDLTFERLEVSNVSHTYYHEHDDSNFVLGPINLTFRPGELIFLVGGNGSGKSTLAKIITGLYIPEGGEIRLDGEPITDRNRDDYRQLFSAVFSDFYIFENLLGLKKSGLDAQARTYLEMLHLNHKVKVNNGARFSRPAQTAGAAHGVPGGQAVLSVRRMGIGSGSAIQKCVLHGAVARTESARQDGARHHA